MAIDNFIKSLLQTDLISETDALLCFVDHIGYLTPEDYDMFISLCKRNHISDESFFMRVYINASEDVQYRLWKDGYVNSCPAQMLINDIVSEDKFIENFVRKAYEEKFIRCEAYFSNIQEIIIKYLFQAKESLKIAMAWFTNPLIFDALLRACKRGVEVSLLINSDAINNRFNGLPFDRLIEHGATLYIAKPPSLIHHKFCIVDEQIVIDGSYNWTILAENSNDENIIVVSNGRVINTFIEEFSILLQNNTQVDAMPAQVYQRQEYDCTSYKFINSEEYLLQLQQYKSKHKQYGFYKEIYKLLPENSAKEKMSSDVFEVVKHRVQEERNHDNKLFADSLATTSYELQKNLEENADRIDALTYRKERLVDKKNKEIDTYKTKIKRIKSMNLDTLQKESKLSNLRKKHKDILSKQNKVITQIDSQIDRLTESKNSMIDNQELIESIDSEKLCGNRGLFRVNLQWNTADDLDLHFILPDGTIDNSMDIHYSNKEMEYKGGFCYLDHDAIPSNSGEHPQENIVWNNCLPDGRYRVAVKLYSKKSVSSRIPFSVTMFTEKGVYTELFCFNKPNTGDVISIATIIFKEGKIISPISFNKKSIKRQSKKED